jgi:hypothetical protein
VALPQKFLDGNQPESHGIGINMIPGDPPTFQVELQRAPDDGSGGPGAFATIANLPPLPAAATYIDLLPLDNAFRHYRWRHIGPGYDPSPLWSAVGRGKPTRLEGPAAAGGLISLYPLRRDPPMSDGDWAVASASNDGKQIVKEGQIEGQVRKLSSALTFIIPNAELEVWESSSQPHGWSVDTTGGASAAKETTPANIFSGDAALKYSNPDNASAGGWHGVATNEAAIGAFCVALRPGGSYTMRLGSRASRAGLGQQYRLRLSFNAGETLTFMQAWSYKAANTYQLDIITFTVPSNADKNSKVYVEFNRNGDATATDFWLDSIRVDELVDRLFFDNGNVTGNVTLDWSLAPTQRVRLTGNTTFTFLNGRPGNRYVLEAQQDGTGSRTGTWSPSVTWGSDTPPTLSTGANKLDTFAFEVVGSPVTYYRGSTHSLNVSSYGVQVAIRDIQVLSSQTVGTTIAISGLTFAPKLILVLSSGRDDASDAAGRADYYLNFGAATSTSVRRVMTCWSDDGVATGDASRYGGTDAVANEIAGASRTGALDVSAFNSDGVTLIVDDQFVTSRRYTVVLIGGETFQAALGNVDTPAATGNQTVTGIGFTPTGLLLFGGDNGTANLNLTVAHAIFGMGAAQSTSARYALANAVRDNETTQKPVSYGFTGECYADGELGSPPDVTATRFRADFVSFGSGQFTINWLETALARTVFYIAVAGCRTGVANLATLTDTTTDITVGQLAVLPKFGLLFSHNRPNSTQNVDDNDAQLSLGVFAENPQGGPPVQRTVSTMQKFDAGVASVVAGAGLAYAAAYQNLAVADGSLEGRMQVTAITPGGFTARMDDADPSGSHVGCWLIGA